MSKRQNNDPRFLTKAIADAKTAYFESIARLIVENPTVTLADLRRKYDISRGDMSKAQRLFQIYRKRGCGSSAHKKGGYAVLI